MSKNTDHLSKIARLYTICSAIYQKELHQAPISSLQNIPLNQSQSSNDIIQTSNEPSIDSNNEPQGKKYEYELLKKQLEELIKAQGLFIRQQIVNKNHQNQQSADQVKLVEEFKKIINLLIKSITAAYHQKNKKQNFLWESLIALSKITANNYTFQRKTDSSNIDLPDTQQAASQGVVIALPYEPEPQPIKTDKDIQTNLLQGTDISRASPQASYYKQDDDRFSQYVDKRFVTVQRQGISLFATNMAQQICTSLIQPLLSNKNIDLVGILHISQLLEQISSPIYTYHLLNLFNDLTSRIETVLETIEQQKYQIKKQNIEKLLYRLFNISERWSNTVNDNKIWQMKIKSRSILALMSSPISQSKLTGVKMLIQIFRKAIYTPTQQINQEQIHKFIKNNQILEKIYNPDNHPEIINKGRQIYELLSRQGIISQQQMDILLRLLDKTHENVSKTLYTTIQNLGQKNLEFYGKVIFDRIVQLPRASCFSQQTLLLIETLMIIIPLENMQHNLKNIYTIINKNYRKLKKHIRQKLIKLYFQVFVMGVQEGILYKQVSANINQQNLEKNQQSPPQDQKVEWMDMSFVESIAKSESSDILSLMMRSFNNVTKNQVGKSVYNKCRQILNKAIYLLFNQYKIHLNKMYLAEENTKHFLELLKFLLQIYESNIMPLPYQQICQLMQSDIGFAKFIQFYSQTQQMSVFDRMCEQFMKRQLDSKSKIHISNIVQLSSLMSLSLKKQIRQKLMELYLRMIQQLSPYQKGILSKYMQKINKFSIEQITDKVLQPSKNKDQKYLESQLLILKQCLNQYDQKGFSNYLPYRYLFSSYSITLKITNSLNVFEPIQWIKQIMSYQTVIQIISIIMSHFKIQKLSGIKIKINNQKYLGVNDFSSSLQDFYNKYTPNSDLSGAKVMKLIIFECFESGWFDKSQLMNSDDVLHDHIIIALKQIFTKFTVGGRMFRKNCSHIFEIATETQQILPTDSRIQYIFNHFSNNGEFLVLQDWLNFYQKSGQDNPGLVIDNLKKLGYKSLFKDEDILHQYTNQGQNEARKYLTSSNNGSLLYQLLFTKFSNADLNKLCLQILQILPLMPKIKNEQKSIKLAQFINTTLQQINPSQDEDRWRWYLISYIYLQKEQRKIQENIHQQISQNLMKKDSEDISLMLTSIHFEDVLISLLDILHENIAKRQVSALECIYIKYILIILKKALIHLQIPTLQYITISASGSQPIEQPLNMQTLMQKVKISKDQQLQQKHKDIQNIIKNHKFFNDFLKYQNFLQICQKYIESKQIIQSLIKSYILFLRFYTLQHKQLPVCFHKKQVPLNYNYIFHHNNQIRKIFNDFYYSLSFIAPSIKTKYYDIKITCEVNNKSQNQSIYCVSYTVDNNSQRQKIYSSHCAEYFEIMNKLLQDQSSQNQMNICQRVTQTIEKSIKQIVNPLDYQNLPMLTYKSQQQPITAISSNIIDASQKQQLLIGQLSLLDSMKVYHPELKIASPESWVPVLLKQPLSNKTKQIVYRISNKLCSVDYNLQLLKDMMGDLCLNKNSFKIRSNHQKMGLYNLGCICYINSTIQQLFMIQQFRNGIIATNHQKLYNQQQQQQKMIDINQQENNLIKKTENQRQKYFAEFQKMIYFLFFSRRQFYIPDKFCLTYTDSNNQPINTKQQHDADQFLNSLFDRLQHTLSKTQKNNLIHQNFRGKMANIIHCQSCFSHRIKFQDFYVLSLQIKNHKTLTQCLQKIAQPQIITDYYCSHCDKKVESIHKYHKLKQLPKYLFIHFQRLVFDLETLSKIKLQDKIDYQLSIDFQQFLFNEADQQGNQQNNDKLNQNSKNKESSKYCLRGFIVHIGTSESGHYYSLVRNNNTWIKFDDSRVSYWDWNQSIAQRQGAYMLIYQRVIQPSSQIQSFQLQIGNKNLYKSVAIDNINLIKQTTFLQKSFTSHLLHTLSRIQIPIDFIESIGSYPNQLQIPYHPEHQQLPQMVQEHLQKAHIIIHNYLKLVSQVRNLGVTTHVYEYKQNLVRNAVCYLIMIYHLYPNMIYKGLEYLYEGQNTSSNYFRLINTHPDKLIRQSYKLIFIKIISILNSVILASNTPSQLFLAPAPQKTNMKYLQNILNQCNSMISDVGRNYTKMQEYFELIAMIVQISEGCCQWLQINNFGPKLIHLLLQQNSPLKSKLPVYSCSISSISKKQNFINLISCIVSKLIYKHYQPHKNNKPENNQLAKIAYSSIKYVQFIHNERGVYENVHKALLLCIKNQKQECKPIQDTTQWNLCYYALSKLNRFSPDDSYIMAYVHLVQQLLVTSTDFPYQFKLQWILGVPVFVVDQGQQIKHEQIPPYKPSYRYYKYINPISQSSDQIILPLLQLLYINRYHINYFTLITNGLLLRLMINQSQLRQYILCLPSPQMGSYEYYYEWINQILGKALKDENVFAEMDKKMVINEIAASLNYLDRMVKGDGLRKLSNNSDEDTDNNQKMQRKLSNQDNTLLINSVNSQYRLNGLIQKTQIQYIIQIHQDILLQVQQLADNQKNSILFLTFKISDKQKIIKISQFKISIAWEKYNYGFYLKQLHDEHTIKIIYPNQLLTLNQTQWEQFIKQTIRVQAQIHKKQQNMQQNYQLQYQHQQNSHPIVLGDTSQQNNHNNTDTIIQCPFCMNISYQFVSRCPNCGEQWGAFM